MRKRLVLCERRKQAVGDGASALRQEGQPVIIAVDLSRSKWVYSCRWGGQEQRRVSTPAQFSHLQRLVEEYRAGGDVHLVYEACGFGYQIAWWAHAQGVTVLVVAPSTVEQAPGAVVKTDRRDARGLGLKYEGGQLKGVYIPPREQHELRQLSRSYAQAVSDRKRQQQRLRMLPQEHGRLGPEPGAGWQAYARWLERQVLPAAVGQCVDEMRQLRAAADGSAKRLGQALRATARQPPYRSVVRALAGQSGVGRLTAIRFVLEIGDVHRFASADSLANYLGLAPSEYSSGARVHRGHVRKCGPGHVRGWMVQCAWACVRRGQDRPLVELFDRVSARAGRKRAIVAVARKLALRLRARWLEGLDESARAA